MQRRDFLRWAAVGTMLPAWARGAEEVAAQPPRPRSLVLVELKGGNDGLNTLVPHTDPDYYRLRPRLAIPADAVLALDDRLGLHPSLGPLLPAWQAGELAWVQGLGYNQPNRSHFRSIDIWETASDSDQVLEQGWLGRVMPARAPDALPDVVILGGDDGPAHGGPLRVITLKTPEQFAREAAGLRQSESTFAPTPALAHLHAVRAQVRQAASEVRQALKSSGETPLAFPRSPLGDQLREVTRMLLAGMAIPVFKVQIGSFDTHANQLVRHQRLLAQLAEALAAFRHALGTAGLWDQVLLMTYSEFGRRVAENGTGGTDHGTAAPHLVLGGRVKGGLYGEAPSLSALDRGDLLYTTDYRRLYTTLAQGWWGSSPPSDLAERFPAMAWL